MNSDERFSNTRLDETFKDERFSNLRIDEIGTMSKAAAEFAKPANKARRAMQSIDNSLRTRRLMKTAHNVGQIKGALKGGAAVAGVGLAAMGAKKVYDHFKKKNAKNEAAIGAALKTFGSKVGTGAKTLGSKVANSKFGTGAKELGSKIKTGATNFGNDLKDVGKNTLSGVKNVGGAIKAHPIRTAAIGGIAGGAALGTYGAKKAGRAAKKAYDDWNV